MEEDRRDNSGITVKKQQTGLQRSSVFMIAAIMLLGGFILGTRSDSFMPVVGSFFGVKTTNDSVDLSSVQKTYRELLLNYDGQLDKNALIDGASRGLVAAAGDRYTVFMDKKEAEEFKKELSGEISGIGAEMGVRNGQPTILRLLADSPAEKSGLAAGDTIIGVNDISMRDADAETAAKNIRGEEGTSVKIIVRRGTETKDFTITRAKVSDVSVRSRIQDSIGILTISRFDLNTGTLARRAAEDFKAANVKGIVLDLRDNGGGYLDAGRDVAGLWVKDRVIVSEREGDKVLEEVTSSGEAILAGLKTVVLVNNSSASASEIVAGALQDYDMATLVGEKTFGKGTVQKMVQLPGDRLLKVTIARWYTPNGKNITKEGITPDQTVALSLAEMNEGKDPQLDAALSKF